MKNLLLVAKQKKKKKQLVANDKFFQAEYFNISFNVKVPHFMVAKI